MKDLKALLDSTLPEFIIFALLICIAFGYGKAPSVNIQTKGDSHVQQTQH